MPVENLPDEAVGISNTRWQQYPHAHKKKERAGFR